MLYSPEGKFDGGTNVNEQMISEAMLSKKNGTPNYRPNTNETRVQHWSILDGDDFASLLEAEINEQRTIALDRLSEGRPHQHIRDETRSQTPYHYCWGESRVRTFLSETSAGALSQLKTDRWATYGVDGHYPNDNERELVVARPTPVIFRTMTVAKEIAEKTARKLNPTATERQAKVEKIQRLQQQIETLQAELDSE